MTNKEIKAELALKNGLFYGQTSIKNCIEKIYNILNKLNKGE